MATTIALKNKRARRDTIAYSDVALRQNAAILEYCRTSVSALTGVTAGILGLTGLYGFVFYFVSALLMTVLLLFKTGTQWHRYFMSRKSLFTSGLFGGLFTYILFWTYPFHLINIQSMLIIEADKRGEGWT